MSRKVNLVAAAAALAFFPLFLVRGMGRFDFWWGMSGAIAGVAALSFALDGAYVRILADDWGDSRARKILFGALTAVILYLVFLALNSLSRKILPIGRDRHRPGLCVQGGSFAGSCRAAHPLPHRTGRGDHLARIHPEALGK